MIRYINFNGERVRLLIENAITPDGEIVGWTWNCPVLGVAGACDIGGLEEIRACIILSLGDADAPGDIVMRRAEIAAALAGEEKPQVEAEPAPVETIERQYTVGYIAGIERDAEQYLDQYLRDALLAPSTKRVTLFNKGGQYCVGIGSQTSRVERGVGEKMTALVLDHWLQLHGFKAVSYPQSKAYYR